MKKFNLKTLLIFVLVFATIFVSTACGNSGSLDDNINNDLPEIDDNTDDTGNGSGGDNSGDTDEDNNEGNKPDESHYDKCIKIETDGLAVRSGEGVNYTKIGTLYQDDVVSYLDESASWYKINYKEKEGYISKKYTSLITFERSNDLFIETIVELGETLIGYPYIFGSQRLHYGNGIINTSFVMGKFDCSSLMQYIFFYGNGTLLDVTTRSQVLQGQEIKKNNIKRGDVIFFTNASRVNNSGIERIGHVALYLGNNYIYHTASDYAIIEPITATRWSYYITTKRMF